MVPYSERRCDTSQYLVSLFTTANIVLQSSTIIRQMSHDPDVYRDPFAEKPERFLSQGGHKPEPDPLAFGFGRR